MLEYAEEVTRHVRSSPELIQRLKEHLSEQELVELNLMVGLANLTNRFCESFQPEFL